MIAPVDPTFNIASGLPPLRVLLVADDVLARTGLVSMLSQQSEHLIVGQVASEEVSDALSVYQPDVILWDTGWEPTGALDRLADLEHPIVPVLILIAEGTLALKAWSAGARGLFLRSSRIDLLIAALAPLSQGLLVIDPALSEALFAPRERPLLSSSNVEALTRREMEVLQFMAQGLANKVIARRLSISESTVKFHVNSILSKLGAQSRTDAVVRASRMGFILL